MHLAQVSSRHQDPSQCVSHVFEHLVEAGGTIQKQDDKVIPNRQRQGMMVNEFGKSVLNTLGYMTVRVKVLLLCRHLST